MSTVKVALRPKNEAPRRSGKTVRGTTNYINNSKTVDSTTALRLQRLRLLGIIGMRAELIASIAWEAV
jgi:hypothetical protein